MSIYNQKERKRKKNTIYRSEEERLSAFEKISGITFKKRTVLVPSSEATSTPSLEVSYNDFDDYDVSDYVEISHSQRIETKDFNWNDIKKAKFGSIVRNNSIFNRSCAGQNCVNTAEYLCKSCAEVCAFCLDHSQPHIRQFSHGLFDAEGLAFGSELDTPSKIMMSIKSWYHEREIKTSALLESDKWFPCTPKKPTVFFSFDMMEAASTQLTFCKNSFESIVMFFEKGYDSPPPDRWKNSFSEALLHFATWQMEIKGQLDSGINIPIGTAIDQRLQSDESTVKRTKCPICFPVKLKDDRQRTVILVTIILLYFIYLLYCFGFIKAFDGCFSLKRFSGHAHSILKPALHGTFFLESPKPNRDEALGDRSQEECNDFRSGDSLRKQSDFCDVSGLFAAVCTHGFVFSLINISKGESLEYAITMAEAARKENTEARLVIAYDIFCKLRNNQRFKADVGFIPEMHAFNHVETCQSKSSPRRMLGIGLKDGEDCERFWSQLRNIVSQTSVMRNENREDVIALVCESINDSSLDRLVERLKNDFKRCQRKLEELQDGGFDFNDVKDYSVVKDELKKINDKWISDLDDSKNLPIENLKSAILSPLICRLNTLKLSIRKKGI